MNLDEAMEAATAAVLEAMSASVLQLDDSIPAYPEAYPLTWDINNGWCEDWGTEVERLCPDVYGEWLEDEETGEDMSHYAITNGLFWYDSECPEGVEDWHDLPMFDPDDRRWMHLPLLTGGTWGDRP
jgi:hypothetical protein